ncbi:2-alkyl-3-oxoalkanoate reductase [Dyadobacter sp. CECT 9275]|uniref:2-alkyl-3-oxoalkanoate reductase n=1 Tax=Dyadobacter helix TaxID=2822344 RepID=A0A916J934_9BACT|nr:NAD(P)-dependent oxidoreductase [Dyadobacter sp. CECT 9275]CAG4994043.1 2-alkyl-3-oxoalkanoate reductase [Dyadobacter sp. CECT 9275]
MRGKVLITGASGFIGHHLVQQALERGYEVHAGVRPSSDISGLKAMETTIPLVFVYPDFSSRQTLEPLLKEGQYDYIIHGAAVTRAKNREAYNLVNATYTLHLAEAALSARLPLKRFVFMSSLAAIGPRTYAEAQKITEETKPFPVTSYGKSKLLAEKYLADLKELPLTIIRPTAVFGPGEKDIFILFKTLNKGLDLHIGTKPQRLSFVYVKDLVTATLTALVAGESKEHRAYNISDGQEYDRYALSELFGALKRKKLFRFHVPVKMIRMVATLLEGFSALSGKTPVLNTEKVNELTAANWYCSIEAASNELQYVPQYNLKKGLAETLDWYTTNKWL